MLYNIAAQDCSVFSKFLQRWVFRWINLEFNCNYLSLCKVQSAGANAFLAGTENKKHALFAKAKRQNFTCKNIRFDECL
ncbi:hypothetical protein PO073_09230 [Bacteroides thetaiotaomicron]|jgi:hypothetical protein|uniref:hypothetical protein n=1 Tax=Bacteroides thetaiotaomicron TaxID=818 RepID=UPI00189E8811|nr:hypothetical protein [Bacteroides thetaiotaomicron]MDC2172604.1 hypothetical protein [Bacteroides thetaiotaomicron]MDC2187832.1 hypothetical protein [Bacteroides thetaiotaomicron]